jgi:hypothetical protein
MKLRGDEIAKALDASQDDLVVVSLCRELVAARVRSMRPLGATTSGRTGVAIGRLRNALEELDVAITAMDPSRPAHVPTSDIHAGVAAKALSQEFSL